MDKENKEVDVKKVIQDLADTNWSVNKDEKYKAMQLINGLINSDDELANKFIIELDKATTAIAKKMFSTNESVVLDLAKRCLF